VSSEKTNGSQDNDENLSTTPAEDNGATTFQSNFFRKGVVGDGKATLNEEQNLAFDENDAKYFGGKAGLPYGRA
jgi:hypothetical protein